MHTTMNASATHPSSGTDTGSLVVAFRVVAEIPAASAPWGISQQEGREGGSECWYAYGTVHRGGWLNFQNPVLAAARTN